MEKYKQFNIGNVELPVLNAFRLSCGVWVLNCVEFNKKRYRLSVRNVLLGILTITFFYVSSIKLYESSLPSPGNRENYPDCINSNL